MMLAGSRRLLAVGAEAAAEEAAPCEGGGEGKGSARFRGAPTAPDSPIPLAPSELFSVGVTTRPISPRGGRSDAAGTR